MSGRREAEPRVRLRRRDAQPDVLRPRRAHREPRRRARSARSTTRSPPSSPRGKTVDRRRAPALLRRRPRRSRGAHRRRAASRASSRPRTCARCTRGGARPILGLRAVDPAEALDGRDVGPAAARAAATGALAGDRAKARARPRPRLSHGRPQGRRPSSPRSTLRRSRAARVLGRPRARTAPGSRRFLRAMAGPRARDGAWARSALRRRAARCPQAAPADRRSLVMQDVNHQLFSDSVLRASARWR